MTSLKAFKMDGLGNSFIIIDRRNKDISLSKEEIIKLKKTENFDQLIYIDKEQGDILPVKIFNHDGKEVDACGNGSRCVAYILGKEKNINEIKLKTKNRNLEANIFKDRIVKINMGKPNFEWNKIPISKKIDNENINLILENIELNKGFALNVGNPHIIFFVEDFHKYNLKKIGPLVENHELFPDRCNLTLAKIEDKKRIKIYVWERGAGITKACGTAACATTVAAFNKGLTERSVNIIFEQGSLFVEFDRSENIFMTGPVSRINEIDITF